ncbi:TIGR04222 domain-containing membrane protein [Streptomyces sp. NPDC006879]|uniref:TIGR04222 domain-containing membrane protein n=1 Tax=Streptomyces sp. NPDC006879 TaxID=3364767 RepID=UPI00368B4EFC
MDAIALIVWLLVLGSATGLLLSQTTSRRAATRASAPLDRSQAAFLSGGPGRAVDAALVALSADRRLLIGGPGIVSVAAGARAHEQVEQAVLSAAATAPDGALHRLRYEVMRSHAVQEIGDLLAARGLLTAPGRPNGRRRWALAQAVLCGLAVPAAFALSFIQFFSEEDGHADQGLPFVVQVLPVLIGGLVVGVVRARAEGRRVTAAGRQAVREAHAEHPPTSDPGWLVALRGVRSLPDLALRRSLLAAARSLPTTGHVRNANRGSDSDTPPVVLWCAGTAGGPHSGCGGSTGNGCGSSSDNGSDGSSSHGSGCSSSGSSCGSSSSSCGSSCS